MVRAHLVRRLRRRAPLAPGEPELGRRRVEPGADRGQVPVPRHELTRGRGPRGGPVRARRDRADQSRGRAAPRAHARFHADPPRHHRRREVLPMSSPTSPRSSTTFATLVREVVQKLYPRLLKCAEAGALATETRLETQYLGGILEIMPNETLGRVARANLMRLNDLKYDDEEAEFADRHSARPWPEPPLQSVSPHRVIDRTGQGGWRARPTWATSPGSCRRPGFQRPAGFRARRRTRGRPSRPGERRSAARGWSWRPACWRPRPGTCSNRPIFFATPRPSIDGGWPANRISRCSGRTSSRRSTTASLRASADANNESPSLSLKWRLANVESTGELALWIFLLLSDRSALRGVRRARRSRRHSFCAWTSIGLGGGGAMYTPAISPADPSLILLSCDMSGVYRSTDGGKNWEMIHYRQLTSSTRVRPAWHPTDPNVAFAAGRFGGASEDDAGHRQDLERRTGEPLRCQRDRDRSRPPAIDAGRRPPRHLPLDRRREELEGSSARPRRAAARFPLRPDQPGPRRTCFAATDHSFFRSDDGGAPGTTSATGFALWADRLASRADRTRGAKTCVLYCSVESREAKGQITGGIYRSDDRGATWTRAMGQGSTSAPSDGKGRTHGLRSMSSS